MAGTTISQIAPSNLTMRWKAPFLTADLNTKLSITTPAGIYRGFRLTTDAANLHVTIAPDAVGNDHYAFYLTASGYGLGIWIKGGGISLDLSAFASKTILIALYATYALGSTTTAEIRVYELSPTDQYTGAAEKGEILILGTVVMPAANLVPAANLLPDKRTEAWSQVASDATPWAPLIRNGDFEWNDGGVLKWSVAFWEHDEATAWSSSTSDKHSGNSSVLLTGTGAGQSGSIYQWIHVPARAGTLLRIRLWVKVVQVSTAGSMTVFLEWKDHQNANATTTTISVATGSVDNAWRLIEQTIAVPTGSFVLSRVGVQVSTINFANNAAAIYLDDCQVYLERKGTLEGHWEEERKLAPAHVSSLVMGDTNQATTADELALWWDKAAFSGEGSLWGGYKNNGSQSFAPIFQWLGRLVMGGKLLSNQNQAARARLQRGYSSAAFTLMDEYLRTGQPGVRVYLGSTGEMHFVFNAGYHLTNADQWTKDVANSMAWRLVLTPKGGAAVHTRAPGSNTPWGDSSWVKSATDVKSFLFDVPRATRPHIRAHCHNGTTISIFSSPPFCIFDNAGAVKALEFPATGNNSPVTTLSAADVIPGGAYTPDTWLYAYAAYDAVQLTTLYFLSETAPIFTNGMMTMTGQQQYRYLFSARVLANGAIRLFTHLGGRTIYDDTDGTEYALVSGASTSYASIPSAGSMDKWRPPHVRRLFVQMWASNSASSSHTVNVRPATVGSGTGAWMIVPSAHLIDVTPTYNNGRMDKETWVNTDDSGNIAYKTTHANCTLNVDVRGWEE